MKDKSPKIRTILIPRGQMAALTVGYDLGLPASLFERYPFGSPELAIRAFRVLCTEEQYISGYSKSVKYFKISNDTTNILGILISLIKIMIIRIKFKYSSLFFKCNQNNFKQHSKPL
jgi:hypothetical protein